MQVLVVGKISQAAILAAAAYRNHETFKRQTGIKNCRLIYDREHHDTKVGTLALLNLVVINAVMRVCQQSSRQLTQSIMT